jgi:hypothetical protein
MMPPFRSYPDGPQLPLFGSLGLDLAIGVAYSQNTKWADEAEAEVCAHYRDHAADHHRHTLTEWFGNHR